VIRELAQKSELSIASPWFSGSAAEGVLPSGRAAGALRQVECEYCSSWPR